MIRVENLVGGFNPFEKYYSNWESSPNRDEHKKYLKPPARNCPLLFFPLRLNLVRCDAAIAVPLGVSFGFSRFKSDETTVSGIPKGKSCHSSPGISSCILRYNLENSTTGIFQSSHKKSGERLEIECLESSPPKNNWRLWKMILLIQWFRDLAITSW